MSVVRKAIHAEPLTEQEAGDLLHAIASGDATPVQIAGALIALRTRGETIDEIAGMARAMRALSEKVNAKSDNLLDTCGTGGDRCSTFNISTTAAFIAAAAGAKIAKHGNRAVSSPCGSADVLEALGIKIDLAPPDVARAIDQVGIGFMFAPVMHPAMKGAAPIRRELGARTIFNLLGPLTNPAGAKIQLLGVFDKKWVRPVAEALGQLGSKRALVVHGEVGLDEISPVGTTFAALLDESGAVTEITLSPSDFGLKEVELSQIEAGASPSENAEKLRLALSEPGHPCSVSATLNAAAAIWLCGLAPTLLVAAHLAQEAVGSGEALAKVEELIRFA